MSKKEPGYIYILTNNSFKEDWIKIDVSKKNTLSASGLETADNVPLPYCIYATIKFEEYEKAAKLLSSFRLDCIHEKKVKGCFFNYSPKRALEELCDIAYINLQCMEVSIYEDNITHILSFNRGLHYLFSFYDDKEIENFDDEDYDEEYGFNNRHDYSGGWTDEELRDACDAAYEGYSRIELGLD